MSRTIKMLAAMAVFVVSAVAPVAIAGAQIDDIQHHPEIGGVCDPEGGFTWTAAAWDTDDPLRRTTPDGSVRVDLDGTEIGRGEFNPANSFTFSGHADSNGILRVTAEKGFLTPGGGLVGAGSFREVTIECEGPPPTTTTSPPPTTTTAPPPETTLPPETTTTTTVTVPPPPTTFPPTIGIDLTVACLNRDAVTNAVEQIVSFFSGTYTVGSVDEFDVLITVQSPVGTFLPEIHPVGLPTYGHHDNATGHTLTDWVLAIAYVDGNEVARSLEDCSPAPPPPPPPPDEGKCVADSTSSTGSRWVGGPNDGEEALPCTGVDYDDLLRLAGVSLLVAISLLGFERYGTRSERG